MDETPDDWTSFDVSRSKRMLRVGTFAHAERELRKLHLIWWHASRSQTDRALMAAGAPRHVIDHVPKVIDTCRECRARQQPGHGTTPAVALATTQNEQVEA